jgi:hypothetical protein
MHHAFFLGVIVSNSIIFILDTFPCTISGGGYCTFTLAPAGDVDV